MFGRRTDDSNFYFVEVLPNTHSTDSLRLFKQVSGGNTLLGSFDATLAVGDVFKLEITDFIVGYSGGKDSGVVLHRLNDLGLCSGVLFLDTKVGVRQTKQFVEDQCYSLGLPLYTREPSPLSFAYVAYCLQFGFPGPRMHSAIMKILKYNSMKKFAQDPRWNKTMAIVGGVRKSESQRRFGSYNTPITKETPLWFVNPIFHESQESVYEFFLKNNIKKSPTYDTLGFSGECMCGSFATKEEAMLIKKVDPELFELIEWITQGIKKFGTATAKKYSKWGATSDFDDVINQQILENFFTPEEQANLESMELNTCGTDCGPGTLRGMNP